MTTIKRSNNTETRTHLRHIQVPRQFRETCYTLIPTLWTDHDWLLLQHFLFTGQKDGDGILCDSETIHNLTGGGHHTGSRKKVVSWAERHSLSCRLTGFDRLEGKATVATIDLPRSLVDAAEKIMEKNCEDYPDPDLVDLVTGEPLTGYAERRAREEYDRYIRQVTGRSKDHPAWQVLEYLNLGQNKAQQHIVGSNLQLAHERAMNMPAGRKVSKVRRDGSVGWVKDREMARRDAALRALFAISQRKLTRYKPVSGSARLFAEGITANSLPRELRKTIYAGCLEADLACAQLAIAAAVLEATKLQEFLASGGRWWNTIISFCGSDEIKKPAFKSATYAALFGAGDTYVRYLLAKGDIWDDGAGFKSADRFFRHELVRELFRCRERYLEKIKRDGFAVDAFGREIRLSEIQDKKDDDARARSVMACVMQSFELRVLSSVLPVVENTGRCHMVSWLHDGCVVSLTKKGRMDQHKIMLESLMWELRDAVDTRLDDIYRETKLRFHTRLEVDELPVPGPLDPV